jgi:catechol 2,3-dioxygenase-like lactoylglutathione lyase family enzyme
MSTAPLIIPELDVTDLSVSLKFYCEILGFQVLYDRPEERFAMIDLAGVRLMLEQADGPGRRFRTAPLEQPFGRGVNFQIEIENVRATYDRVVENRAAVLIPLERRWYRVGEPERAQDQFVVCDPDGYLLRLISVLG